MKFGYDCVGFGRACVVLDRDLPPTPSLMQQIMHTPSIESIYFHPEDPRMLEVAFHEPDPLKFNLKEAVREFCEIIGLELDPDNGLHEVPIRELSPNYVSRIKSAEAEEEEVE